MPAETLSLDQQLAANYAVYRRSLRGDVEDRYNDSQWIRDTDGKRFPMLAAMFWTFNIGRPKLNHVDTLTHSRVKIVDLLKRRPGIYELAELEVWETYSSNGRYRYDYNFNYQIGQHIFRVPFSEPLVEAAQSNETKPTIRIEDSKSRVLYLPKGYEIPVRTVDLKSQWAKELYAFALWEPELNEVPRQLSPDELGEIQWSKTLKNSVVHKTAYLPVGV